MAEMTIGQARDSFSALIAQISSGEVGEHVIKNRDVPVARIVPYHAPEDASRRIGISKDRPLVLDDDLFDALDDEIAKEFGTL